MTSCRSVARRSKGSIPSRPSSSCARLRTQALAFFAGANSIFYGEKLLTTSNPQNARDRALLGQLGIATEGCA